MVDPAVASCGHSFCHACIHAYLGYPHKRRRRPSALPVHKPCPVCNTVLPDPTVFPNIALAALVQPAHFPSAMHSAASPLPLFDVDRLPDADADALLACLLSRRAKRQDSRHALRTALVLPFLERCHQEATAALDRVNDDLRLITTDLQRVRTSHRVNNIATASSLAPTPAPAPAPELHLLTTPDVDRRNHLVSKYHDNMKGLYYTRRRALVDGALESVVDVLVDATSIASATRRATIQHIDIMHGNHNLISSIEFNANGSIFATAGVTKRIKVFEFASVIEPPCPSTNNRSGDPPNPAAHHHYPILEIPTTSKLSCLSWSREQPSILAASTYKGDILVHDTETNTHVQSLREHTKRTWFIDFSQLKPSHLISGSDDHTVKLWDVRTPPSSMTLQTGANVCCVRFNPFDPNEFAFGSADHNVYSYDLRHPNTPLCVFEGHWRAVSHVIFLNRSELISASTDSSCKLWNVKKQEPGLSYGGHSNGRNFVGLSASKDFFACGSEDNAVYVYHKGLAGPVVRYGFGSGGGFVSTVAWKPDSPWLVAATNTGNVEIVELK